MLCEQRKVGSSLAFFKTNGLTKVFGNVTAVKDVSFSVGEGEFVAIIGPNGAGKTTLFNLITGFESITEGTVEFRGEKISGNSPHRIVKKGMTRTFQVPRPFRELSVFDNVDVANPPRDKVDNENSKARTERILKRVGLWDVHDDWASNLPQGDLRRLEVARALATYPDLLLLDEPFAGLNPSEIEILSKLLIEMHDSGLTIIIIEHKMKELMKLAKRIIVLNHGAKIADDLPQNIGKNEKVLKAYLGDRGWDFA